jgi:HSP20 family protein
MRYRYLGYRYAMVVQTGGPPPFTPAWRLERLRVSLAEPRWRPETDVYETPAAITVTVALAGLEPDDIEVSLFDDAVVVEGLRRLGCEESGVYRTAQIPHGPFRVEVPLAVAVDAERPDVRYEHGLLRITLPKAPRR